MPSLQTPSSVGRPFDGSGQSMTLGLTLVRTASSTLRPARSMAAAMFQGRSMPALCAAMTAAAVRGTSPRKVMGFQFLRGGAHARLHERDLLPNDHDVIDITQLHADEVPNADLCPSQKALNPQ